MKTGLILAELRKGGLVVSERGTGKTTALLARALEVSQAGTQVVIVVGSEAMGESMTRTLRDWPTHLKRPRVAWNERQFQADHCRNQFVLVDEYFYHWFRGVGDSAVGTAPFQVSVV
jgi:hypothetical protein